MRPRALLILVALAAAVLILAPATAGRASAGPGGFSSEQPAGTPYKHQSNWEPTVATDPHHPGLVYQLITGINARQCAPRCPGTSVLFRKSTDGGTTWSAEQFVCGLACQGVGWQYDPQIKVAADTNQSCGCGTIYAVFLNTFDPGVVLFKSHDGGTRWQGPITMNGPLSYMDKPVLVISPGGKDVYVAFNGKLHATGVVASGGPDNSVGVEGVGVGSGTGVAGFGGSSSGARMMGEGGPPNGTGVQGTGLGAGDGVLGVASGGNGVHGKATTAAGVGVRADNTAGGAALQATGPAIFSRSGVLTIGAGKSTATKTGVALTTASLVLATLQDNRAGIFVQAAVPNISGSSFTIHLSKAVSANTKAAWFVVN